MSNHRLELASLLKTSFRGVRFLKSTNESFGIKAADQSEALDGLIRAWEHSYFRRDENRQKVGAVHLLCLHSSLIPLYRILSRVRDDNRVNCLFAISCRYSEEKTVFQINLFTLISFNPIIVLLIWFRAKPCCK